MGAAIKATRLFRLLNFPGSGESVENCLLDVGKFVGDAELSLGDDVFTLTGTPRLGVVDGFDMLLGRRRLRRPRLPRLMEDSLVRASHPEWCSFRVTSPVPMDRRSPLRA